MDFNHRHPVLFRLNRQKLRPTPRKVLDLRSIAALLGFAAGALLMTTLATFPSRHRATSILGSQFALLDRAPASLSRPVNFLILGIDQTGASSVRSAHSGLSGNSDTILLVRLLPDSHQVHVLSIPRDTLVQIPGIGSDKINSANVQGGIPLAGKTVSQLLGGIAIDRYIRLNTAGLVQLVDALGGVEINVPKAMYYRDRTQNLTIQFAPGQQWVKGQQLQEYVRFRHDSLGDIGRVQRQQAVLKAILHQFLQPATLVKLPQLTQVIQANLETDLSLEELLAVLHFLTKSNLPKMQLTMWPGRFSRSDEYDRSYWITDPQRTSQALTDFLQKTTLPESN